VTADVIPGGRSPSDPAEVQAALWGGVLGSVGWDVGANDGDSLARMLGLFSAEVHSFEPASESFARLRRRFSGARKARLHELAMGDRDGTLVTAEREGPIRTGQLVAVRDMPEQDAAVPHPLQALPWGPVVGEREVRCVTADAFARVHGMPDFVKVDTEGHEAQILAGASTLLRAGAAWLVEFHSEELHEECVGRLSAAGYRAWTIRHPHYAPATPMYHRHGWVRAEKVRGTFR
jgi:FkbM family methyltransferase